MSPRNAGELPWTPAETKQLVSHAEVVASLRDKAERGTANDEEKKRFAKAVFAIKRSIEDKERPPSQVIAAESKDGKTITFDLYRIREQWDTFYRSHNLDSVADLLPQKIVLTAEQVEILQAKAKEGFTRPILIPAGIEQHLLELKKNLTDGLEKDAAGKPIETFLSDNVKPSFPNQIQTTDPERVGKAYLLFTNPDQPLFPGSKNKSPDELILEFQALGLSGLTLADFLIEERSHFEQTNQHLIDWGKNDWTWLLASRDSASRVLNAHWVPGNHRVGVHSNPPGHRGPSLGARPSVVFGLEL